MIQIQSIERKPTIGIITALPKEYAAVKQLLDNPQEINIEGQGAGRRYLHGEVIGRNEGKHAVVLCLAVQMGNNSAAIRASQLLEHFPEIQSIIMVGIAGGIPYPEKADDHVRLGDIVIANEKGVIQYDFDKETITENIDRHPPRPPSPSLLEGVKLLEADELEGKKPWLEFVERALLPKGEKRPSSETDILVSSTASSENIQHPPDSKREEGEPRIFIAPIASANKLLKNPVKRDELRDKFGVKAVEMEGSGIADATWNHGIGYLVIRGICDYCDSKKGDNWQAYAAAVAAAYTRALLESMPTPKSYIDSQPSTIKSREQKPDVVKEIKFSQPSQYLIPNMYLLHLSDLHFGTLEQAQRWSNQLAEDLTNELNISSLDALVLSGDIANKSSPDEYESAKNFLDNFRRDFPLNPKQIIIVPGNHDINWEKSEEAYCPIRRKDYKGKTITVNGQERADSNYAIDDGGRFIEQLDLEAYKRRFAYFRNFYENIKQDPYPLEYQRQYTIDFFSEQKLLILGLNSAWKLDHYYKKRADINTIALSNALAIIRRNSDYENCLKIAVWHHPLDSVGTDQITDRGLMEQLAKAGFRIFLHGHIHKAETSLYRHDMSQNGRKLDGICAGTFGAPTKELVSGYPWQYNLLKFEGNQLTVETRRREEENGAWKPDARWSQGAGKDPLPRYFIQLTDEEVVPKK